MLLKCINCSYTYDIDKIIYLCEQKRFDYEQSDSAESVLKDQDLIKIFFGTKRFELKLIMRFLTLVTLFLFVYGIITIKNLNKITICWNLTDFQWISLVNY